MISNFQKRNTNALSVKALKSIRGNKNILLQRKNEWREFCQWIARTVRLLQDESRGGMTVIQHYESVFYNTLDELNGTYNPNHPDILNLKMKYGDDVQFGRVMHRKGVEPRFELRCYKIKKEVC